MDPFWRLAAVGVATDWCRRNSDAPVAESILTAALDCLLQGMTLEVPAAARLQVAIASVLGQGSETVSIEELLQDWVRTGATRHAHQASIVRVAYRPSLLAAAAIEDAHC